MFADQAVFAFIIELIFAMHQRRGIGNLVEGAGAFDPPLSIGGNDAIRSATPIFGPHPPLNDPSDYHLLIQFDHLEIEANPRAVEKPIVNEFLMRSRPARPAVFAALARFRPRIRRYVDRRRAGTNWALLGRNRENPTGAKKVHSCVDHGLGVLIRLVLTTVT